MCRPAEDDERARRPAAVWAERPSPSRTRTGPKEPTWSVSLEPTPLAPGRGRRALEPLAVHLDTLQMENVLLLASELVTNAVVHAAEGPIVLDVHLLLPEMVVVGITDVGRGFDPARLTGSRDGAPGGRGLKLVAALADCVGIDSRDPFHIWFCIRLRDDS